VTHQNRYDVCIVEESEIGVVLRLLPSGEAYVFWMVDGDEYFEWLEPEDYEMLDEA